MSGHVNTLPWHSGELNKHAEAVAKTRADVLKLANLAVGVETQKAVAFVRGSLAGTARYIEHELTSQDLPRTYELIYEIVRDAAATILELFGDTPPTSIGADKARARVVLSARKLRDVLATHQTAREQLDVRRARGESLGADLDHLRGSFLSTCELFESFTKDAEAALNSLGYERARSHADPQS